MSLALQLLIGLLLGVATLSWFGWSAVLFIAAVLFGLELVHDVRLHRSERRG